MTARLLDLSRVRRERERHLRACRLRGNAMLDVTWVRLAAERAEASDQPLAVAGRYDRAAIMRAALAFARVRREAGARESWPVLISQGLRGDWIVARRQRPASLALAAIEEAEQRADLGDDPTPATLDLHSPEHDAEMSAWFEAEFAEREIIVAEFCGRDVPPNLGAPTAIAADVLSFEAVADLPEHVPRAA